MKSVPAETAPGETEAIFPLANLKTVEIRSGADVERLALENPAEYQNLLHAYWLRHGGASDSADAVARAARGESPTSQELNDPAVIFELAASFDDVRNAQQTTSLHAAGLLAVARARGQSK